MKLSSYSLLLLASSFCSPYSYAQELPLWEMGIGLAVLDLPDYRGSRTGRTYMLPFPTLIYRGEHLSVDKGGAHGHIFNSERIKLELSLAGGIPVTSDDDGPRSGMPDLDPSLELGPSLELKLWQKQGQRRSVWLILPLRATFSISSSNINHQGWSHSPYIEYVVESRQPDEWKIGLAAGPLYADKEYHNYFYEVDSNYATTEREQYHPEGGYSGSRITLTMQKHFGRLWIGAFTRFDDLSGSAFDDSPLVTTNQYLAFGLVTTWIFAKSSTLVEVSY